MAKVVTILIGAISIALGILGLFSNPYFGANGFFHADFSHSALALITGVVLLGFSYRGDFILANRVIGGILVLLALLGFMLVPGTGSLLGIMEVNTPADILHLALGIVLVWAGYSKKGSVASN